MEQTGDKLEQYGANLTKSTKIGQNGSKLYQLDQNGQKY